MFENILVAVDGSEHGLLSARTAGELARCTDANLFVVTAYEPVHSYKGMPYIQDEINERRSWAEKAQESAIEEIGEIPGELKTEALEGPAAEAILNVVQVRDIDLVIMGTRGRGGLKGLLLGSQSQKVVSHAPCPVMLVK